MCSFNCARSFLFVLSVFFTLAGGALLGLGIFGQVHKPIYGKHLLQSHFDKLENGGASKEQIDRISLYFIVVTGVSIGLGFLIFVAGISGLVGACQNFRVISRYGFKRSTIGCFAFLLFLTIVACGFIAASILYVGFEGKAVEKSEIEATKKPDYKLNWNPVDLKSNANEIFEDLVDFVWKTCDETPSKPEAESYVTNVLSLAGGAFCAIFALCVIWLFVGCCINCATLPAEEAYNYVPPEKNKYDDWCKT